VTVRSRFGTDVCIWGLVAAFLLLLLAGQAAADPRSGLSAAESRAAAAEAKIETLEGSVQPAVARFQLATRRAAPSKKRAHQAAKRVATLEAAAQHRHSRAVAAVKAAEDERSNAAEKHDEKVRSGLGLGLSALILAVIAFTWGWFRATAVVAYLTRISLAQAIGLCVGGGFITLIIGAAMTNAGGVVGVLGEILVGLGLMLPIAFLLARHSAEVQRGRARAWLRRERLPRRVSEILAGVLAVLFMIGIGSGIFAGEAESGGVSAQIHRQAQRPETTTPGLVSAREEAARLKEKAGSLLAVVHHTQADLRTANSHVGRAKARLATADGQVHHFTRQLVALEVQETREAEHEEHEREQLVAQEQHEREQEEQEEQEEIEQQESEVAEECDPNYSGCLDPHSPDYDCVGGEGDGPDYTGTVEVLGYDEFGLDRDGDGIGCDD
jgi:hypothetical protein